nr:hypothetical protein [Holospora curviuscula]
MGANHCGINHDLFRISICCKGIENHWPHTGFGPAYKLFMNPRLFSVRFWQCTPRCTLAGNPHHGVDKFPVIVTSTF